MTKPSHQETDSGDLDGMEKELEAAEAAVAALAESFTTWVRNDLDRLKAEFERANAAPGANRENIAEIFSICHNIKGQAGSFGYTLLTRIGASLCEHVRDAGDASQASLKVIQGHLMAMEFIVDREIDGEGGEVGQKLFKKLQYLAQQTA